LLARVLEKHLEKYEYPHIHKRKEVMLKKCKREMSNYSIIEELKLGFFPTA
jgi:hypothetical protein